MLRVVKKYGIHIFIIIRLGDRNPDVFNISLLIHALYKFITHTHK